MSGLLGALVAGAAGGYAKQRVADMEEKEAFDYANSLKDADFNRQKLLQEMGFDQDMKLEDRRDQRQLDSDQRRLINQIDASDHALENSITLKDHELDAAKDVERERRDRLSGYADDAGSLTEMQANALRGGDIESAGKLAAMNPKPEKPLIEDGMQYYPETDSWKKIKTSGGDNDWKDKDTREFSKSVNTLIDMQDGMTDGYGDEIKNTVIGADAKKIAGNLIKNNGENGYTQNQIAMFSAEIAKKPKEQRYLVVESGGEKYRVKGALVDGNEVVIDDRLLPMPKPENTAATTKPDKAAEDTTEPEVKPRHNSVGLMTATQKHNKLIAQTLEARDLLRDKESELNALTRALQSKAKRIRLDRVDAAQRIERLKQEIPLLKQQLAEVDIPTTTRNRYR